MMRVVNRLLSPSKWSKQIGIGLAASFRVVQNRVYEPDDERFPPGSVGGLYAAPYEIFKRGEHDSLPPHVYRGTYCGLPCTVHYIGSSGFSDFQKWLHFQKACNPGYVLSIRAFYTASCGTTTVFTEPVTSTLFAWIKMMEGKKLPLVNPDTGYIIPFLRSIYRDALTSIAHVVDCTGYWHGNVSLDNIWLRDGSAVLGCPSFMVPAECDAGMFEHVLDIIHHDFLPRELEFFCRILHNDVTVILSLLVHSPFLKTHSEKMRTRFLFVRLFFDSTESSTRKIAMSLFKGCWDHLFAAETEFEVMWYAQLTAQNPVTSNELNFVTQQLMTHEVNFIVSNWMVNGHPIHFLISVRNCAEHGTHLKNEEWFDLVASDVWPDHLSMLSYLVSIYYHLPFLSSFTAFTLKGHYCNIDTTAYPMKAKRKWKAHEGED